MADEEIPDTLEQIAFALRQAVLGLPVVEVCRKMGIAEQVRRAGHAVLTDQVDEQHHQPKLKQLVADLSLDKQMLPGRAEKKALGPAQMRDHAEYLQVAYGSSERRACRVLTIGRSTCRYESVAAEQAALRMRIRDLAASRLNYGYRRIHVLLRREG